MKKKVKKFLTSKYRREMWDGAEPLIRDLAKKTKSSKIYVLGSFTTKKSRPADVDLIVLLKSKKNLKSKWSLDIVIAPDNEYGEFVLRDADRWVREKYGLKKSTTIQLK